MSPTTCHLASVSGPNPLSFFFVLGILILLAAVIGTNEGQRGGQRALSMGKTCSKATSLSFLFCFGSGFFLMTFINFPADWFTWTAELFLEGGLESMLLALIMATIASFIPAPIAAFIAYNFSARKRAEEELARNALSPNSPKTNN